MSAVDVQVRERPYVAREQERIEEIDRPRYKNSLGRIVWMELRPPLLAWNTLAFSIDATPLSSRELYFTLFYSLKGPTSGIESCLAFMSAAKRRVELALYFHTRKTWECQGMRTPLHLELLDLKSFDDSTATHAVACTVYTL